MRSLFKKVIAFMTLASLTLSAAVPAIYVQAENVSSTTININRQSDVTQFMDCFLPMPIIEKLSSDCWGAPEVGARDQGNGLEDRDMSHYSYWDGGIIQDEETKKYYMFASRWDQRGGHEGENGYGGWRSSVAVYATSDNLYGPYEDQGLLWPEDQDGKGHNVFPIKLKDGDPNGKYAIVLSDTRAGEIYVSDGLNGPWRLLGSMPIEDGGSFTKSNVCIIVRPDGKYEAFSRNGDIAIADTIAGPWTVENNGVWWQIPGMPTDSIEDPVIWYGDGLYHCVVNKWDSRQAYYLTSEDGINDWRLHPGKAYTPDDNYLRYVDGTVNNWKKIERPNVYIEDGKVSAMLFSVIDVEKTSDNANDQHGSKIIIVPFDGEALNQFAKQPHPILDRTGDNPIADTNSQSWQDEAGLNYGGREFIQLQRDNSDDSYGLFGERIQGGDDADSKIGYMKFDLSKYDLSKVESASLSLVYTDQFAGDAEKDSIRVALSDSEWEEGIGNDDNSFQADEGVLTWRNQPAKQYNENDIENTTAVSDEFVTSVKLQEVVIDITNLVKTLNPEEQNLSLALCETQGGQRISIASKEMGEGYAPKLTIKETEESDVNVSGIIVDPAELKLNVGEQGKITAQVEPANATNNNVSWSVTNNSVAEVDSKGNVTAKAAGTTKITAKTEDGGFTAACIVTVANNESSNLNTEILEYAIDLAKDVKAKTDWTHILGSVKTNFDNALNKAENILAAAKTTPPTTDQESINQAWFELINAMQYLEFKSDKTNLKTVLDIADKIDLQKYLAVGQEAFTKALDHAREVYADPDAMNEEDINPAWKNLVKAITELRLKPSKAELEKLKNQASSFDLSLYTTNSASMLKAALDNANRVLSNDQATQEEVNSAKVKLQDAMSGLVYKTAEDSSTSNISTVTNNVKSAGNANTSDKTPIALAFVLVAMSSLAIFTLKREDK